MQKTIGVFCVYIKPKIKAADLKKLREMIRDPNESKVQ